MIGTFGRAFNPCVEQIDGVDPSDGSRTRRFLITPETWEGHEQIKSSIESGKHISIVPATDRTVVWKCFAAR